MRPGRVLAVAWRDLRVVQSGRGGWKLPLLALSLLLWLPNVAALLFWCRPGVRRYLR